MNDNHEQIRARGKALCLSDEAIDARIAAVVVGYPISAETREIWAARTEGARCVYSAEHAAGLFCPRVKKTLARWASGKGNLPTPMEIQFLAAIAAYDEVAR